MTLSTKTHRAIAVLSLPSNVPALVTYCTGVIKGLTNNAYFQTPTPPIATLQSATNDVQTAETGAQARAKGAVALRNAKKVSLVTLMEEARTYVQSTADASPENAPAIIQSAGMAVRKTPIRPPRVFAAKPTGISGAVKIVAPAAARRASYEWQYSTDGGKTWLALKSTLQAKTSMTGLTPATTVQFRYRAVIKAGEGDWSQPISLLVT